MTKVINLFGGPGVGKTTLSFELMLKLKKQRCNVELVREYVKSWAWEKREVGALDQFYISAKQARKESLLYGKTDIIVTDSPVMLGAFYQYYYSDKTYIADMLKAYFAHAAEMGVQHYNFFLERRIPYEQEGRYQTEAEAIEVDEMMRRFLVSNVHPITGLGELEGRADRILEFIK